MSPQSQSALWETVRRALGRLVSSVHVRELQPEFTKGIACPDGLTETFCESGCREADWKPQSRVLQFSPPRADAGGAGEDVSGIIVVIRLNAVVSPQEVPVHTSPPRISDVLTHRQDIFDARAEPVHLCEAPVAVGPALVQALPSRIATPRVARLSAQAPRLPNKAMAVVHQLAMTVTIRSKIAVSLEVPMTRERRAAPAGLRFAEAFQAERRELARASHVDLGDVALLGVYPQVPIAAVSRLGLEEEGGELALWLKPEALAASLAGKKPRLATLIVGRQRSTGRMIQTIG